MSDIDESTLDNSIQLTFEQFSPFFAGLALNADGAFGPAEFVANGQDFTSIAFLEPYTSLTLVDLKSNTLGIDEEARPAIQPLSALPALKTLNVANNQLADEDLADLELSSLEHLDISGNSALTTLPLVPALRTLRAAKTGLTDETVLNLINSSPQLELLDLSGTPITALPLGFAHLHTLLVCDCTGILCPIAAPPYTDDKYRVSFKLEVHDEKKQLERDAALLARQHRRARRDNDHAAAVAAAQAKEEARIAAGGRRRRNPPPLPEREPDSEDEEEAPSEPIEDNNELAAVVGGLPALQRLDMGGCTFLRSLRGLAAACPALQQLVVRGTRLITRNAQSPGLAATDVPQSLVEVDLRNTPFMQAEQAEAPPDALASWLRVAAPALKLLNGELVDESARVCGNNAFYKPLTALLPLHALSAEEHEQIDSQIFVPEQTENSDLEY